MNETETQDLIRHEETAFALMRAGVPLSLLLDLAMPVHSAELLREERADTTWVPQRVSA